MVIHNKHKIELSFVYTLESYKLKKGKSIVRIQKTFYVWKYQEICATIFVPPQLTASQAMFHKEVCPDEMV